MNKTFGVLAYPHSNNLGDFIQSLAAEQWLKGKKVVALDRDYLHNYVGQPVYLVMNGWFMEKPDNWPPSDQIIPLFISFHLNPTARKGMLDVKGIAYLKKHQPIGCRDNYTQKLLESHGIKTYFSACLTLSLNRNEYVHQNQKREGIFVISPLERLNPERDPVPKGIISKMMQALKKPQKRKRYFQAIRRLENFLEQQSETVHYSSQLRDPLAFSEEERMEQAKQQLKAIAQASLVITSRIHTALPAVAFGTPVLFLSDGLEHPNQKSRLEGLESFFPIFNSTELAQWKSKTPEPSQAHQPFIERFKKEISRFFKEYTFGKAGSGE